jgi:hypothetical protein
MKHFAYLIEAVGDGREDWTTLCYTDSEKEANEAVDLIERLNPTTTAIVSIYTDSDSPVTGYDNGVGDNFIVLVSEVDDSGEAMKRYIFNNREEADDIIKYIDNHHGRYAVVDYIKRFNPDDNWKAGVYSNWA